MKSKKQKVYIIKAGNFYKIGISNDVKKRLRSIQTANAQKCTIIATLECQNAQAKELEIHRYLSEFRANGEWFMLNDRKLNEIVIKYSFVLSQLSQDKYNILNITNINDYIRDYTGQRGYKLKFEVLADLEKQVLTTNNGEFENIPMISYKRDGDVLFELLSVDEYRYVRIVHYCFAGTVS